MHRRFRYLLLLLPLVAASGCKKDATATVQCGKLEKFRGDVGYFNSANLALGSLVVIDTSQKTGTFLSSIAPASSDTTISPTVGSEESHFASTFEVEASANVPATVTANIKAAINNQTSVLTTNLKRVSINDAASVLNKTPNAVDSVRDAYVSGGSSILVLFVSSIAYADSTHIELANSTQTTADASIMAYGDYKIAVTYKCSGSVNRTGQQFGAYFKTTVVRYDATKKMLVADFNTSLDLSNYNFVNALTAH